MDKREQLEETCNKLREEHEAPAPKPEWGKVEQKLILRLMRQVKARRLINIILLVILIFALAYAALLTFTYPSIWVPRKGQTNLVPRWNVGGISVVRLDGVSIGGKKPNVRYMLDEGLPSGYSFSIVQMAEPIMGSRFIAYVYNEDFSCSYLIKSGLEQNYLIGEGQSGNPAFATKMLMNLVSKMKKDRAWPIALWPVYPAVKQLNEGSFILIANEPYNGYVRASKLYYGAESAISMHLYSSHNNFYTIADATLWPDHFAIAGQGQRPLIAGNPVGYTVYEDETRWGDKVRDELQKLEIGLNFAKEALPFAEGELPAGLLQELDEVTQVTYPKKPLAIKLITYQDMRLMLKPWSWEGWTPEMDERQKELQRDKATFVPVVIAGVKFEQPNNGALQLSRGKTALSFRSSSERVGTIVKVSVDGELELSFDVRHEKPYPVLQKRFDARTEHLLAESASIAKAILSASESSWPNGTVPKPYITSWLSAIESRRIVLREEERKVEIETFLRWEGKGVEMTLGIGQGTPPDIELMLKPDGFTVFFAKEECLLDNTGDSLEITQAESNNVPVLTPSHMRRLRECLKLLSEQSGQLPSEIMPGKTQPRLLRLKPEIPEPIQTGAQKLADFLDSPALPDITKVEKLQPPVWRSETYWELRKKSSL